MQHVSRRALLATVLIGAAINALAGGSPTEEKIDVAEVRRKIAALAAPDETLPFTEQAVHWLSTRREQIVPQLIAALDDPNPRVAEQCLDILRYAAATKDLTEALIAKAGDRRSPLRSRALRQLEKSADDPRAKRQFDQASTEVETFPNPLLRARWAWLAGRSDRAVDILKPTVERFRAVGDSKVSEAVRLLGEIGGPTSIELLKPVAAGDQWQLAVLAYLALAKIDPEHHGLTQDQVALLNGWRGFKETEQNFQQRLRELAKLNVQELLPLVMQMLRDKEGGLKGGSGHGQRSALIILATWKDKEALPQIRRIMEEKRTNNRREAVAAFLAIEDDPSAQQAVLNVVEQEIALRGVVAASIPATRKLALLRAARGKLNIPLAVPQALRYEKHQNQDIGELLIPLMEQETDLQTLAGYCALVADDKEHRFAGQVRRAMELLAHDRTVTASETEFNKGLPSETATAAATILRAAATYDLKDQAIEIQKFMGSKHPTIRAAAQAAGARLQVPGAMEKLYAQLSDAEPAIRQQAVQTLLSIAAVDEPERAAREAAVLSHLGKPSEDDALRVLVTCGGERSVAALQAVMNDADARRGVYAGWLLAQFADQDAALTGLRRVAIFAMFHHQMYQQGAGIDFELAPNLNFHQTTQRLNPRIEAADAAPVRIPEDLLTPFDWNDEEQEYAVRCYRLAERIGNGHGVSIHFLNGRMMGQTRRMDLNRTQLPLLKEIAVHDSRLVRLMIEGQAVAHFTYRQQAAQAIAAITQNEAAYLGLAGETIEAQSFPLPYQDQDRLLAKFFVDRVETAQPRTDRQWKLFEIHRQTARQLSDDFGPQVLDAIRQEAHRRKIDLKRVLPEERS